VPYLNRAIAKESLGVEALARGDRKAAQQLWLSAAADCDAAIERDPKEFAAWWVCVGVCVWAGVCGRVGVRGRGGGWVARDD